MCRLFGYKSRQIGQVNEYLLHTNNAFIEQSSKHQHGWGIAYYIEGSPHIIKSPHKAMDDNVFKKVANTVHSDVIMAHIRNATIGTIDILNTHPFQYGKWVFAHNGNIKNFANHKDALLQLVDPTFKRDILGTTDSEILFYILLTILQRRGFLSSEQDCPLDILTMSLHNAVTAITNITGPFFTGDETTKGETFLTFLITNGQIMATHNGGKRIYYKVTPSGDQVMFSSEPLGDINNWMLVNQEEVVGVASDMKLIKYAIDPCDL